MAASEDNKVFNSDILRSESDRKRAKKKYSRLFHVLNHKELGLLFDEHDEPANKAKKQARRRGLLSILFGTLALLIAAGEPLYHHLLSPWPQVLGTTAGALGVVSVAIAMGGVLFRTKKRSWLQDRLMTERLRQFHFQTFVCRIPEIFASLDAWNPSAAAEYEEREREVWFDEFRDRYENDLPARLTAMLDDEALPEIWLHECGPRPWEQTADDSSTEDVNQLFKAYRLLRVEHQLQYANWQLRFDASIKSGAPRRLNAVLYKSGFACVLGVLVLHMVIAVGVPLDLPIVQTPWLHVAALWCAISALAIRTLSEGLKPAEEIERYRSYRASIQDIARRFDAPESGPAEKHALMIEMERVSFEEMRAFLRTMNDASFVM